tara:strand:+ start:418 stop:825 length:408 start_codon:yes stop_codon:yes gene_type:complete
MAYGIPVHIKDVTAPETVEVVLHHNNPLEYTMVGVGRHVWSIVKATGSTRSNQTTRIVGRLSKIDLSNNKIHVYGGPYSGEGLGRSFVGKGGKVEAEAEIPLSYIVQLWLLKQIEIPGTTEKHGRLNTQKVRVTF